MALVVPNGYISWMGWLAGKAVPVAIFTMFLVTNGLTLPKEVMQVVHEGMHFYPVMELLRHSLTLGFLVLIVAAYLTRSEVIVLARGFWERTFPLLVLFATAAGMSFIGRVATPHRSNLVALGLLLTLLGYSISLWALWHLRGSFAIMAEVRSPVTAGPYRHIRHPLYLGETLTMLGLSFMSGTTIALFFWGAVTGMQLMRACIEEAKLAHRFNDYKAYRESTRFILPGLY
jgi:protein-S-isoprenylcysteine O-methyltransferase Ste14